jgi:Arc/MetJ-type ribon-helix-helix transcriptional regulator
MSQTERSDPITVRLNQQQLELLDRTVERGEAPDREALIRRALREFCEAQSSERER